MVTAGARGKLVDLEDEEYPFKAGRLVWELDMRDVLVLERYVAPLVEWMRYNFTIGSSCGIGSFGRDMMKICQYLHHGGPAWCLCLDRSKWDSTIGREYIVRVLWFIRGLFGEQYASHDEFWFYVLRTVCGVPLALWDGTIYGILHGCASGNPIVQPVETLLNFGFTMVELAYHQVETKGWDPYYALQRTWVGVRSLGLGDDQIATGELQLFPDIQRIASLETQLWGTIVRPDRCWIGPPAHVEPPRWFLDPPRGAFFLGNYLIEGVPWRPIWELLVKLVHPERAGPSWVDELIRLASYRALWWTNGPARRLLDELIILIHPWAVKEFDTIPPSIWWFDSRILHSHPLLTEVDPFQLLMDPLKNWSGYFGEMGDRAFESLEDVTSYLFGSLLQEDVRDRRRRA
jgi:hypothetical protein